MFEIGHKVKWTIGKGDIICRGIFLEEVDNVFSEVQCTDRGPQSYFGKQTVLTELLERDND